MLRLAAKARAAAGKKVWHHAQSKLQLFELWRVELKGALSYTAREARALHVAKLVRAACQRRRNAHDKAEAEEVLVNGRSDVLGDESTEQAPGVRARTRGCG